MNTKQAMSLAFALTIIAIVLVLFLIYDTYNNSPKVEVYTAYATYYVDFGTLTATCENSPIERKFISHNDMTEWLGYITARDVILSEVIPSKAYIAEPMADIHKESLLVLKIAGCRPSGDSTRVIRDTLGYVMIDDEGYRFHSFKEWYQ